MTNVEETAYPRISHDQSDQELEQIYLPSSAECEFVRSHYRRVLPQTCLMLQLKLVQRLGYSVPLSSVPTAIIDHVCAALSVARPSKSTLQRYDASGEKSRHMRMVLGVLRRRELDGAARQWLIQCAEKAAGTKQELADIINVLLEELSANQYVLPGFTYLDRIARNAREKINSAIFGNTMAALDDGTKQRLDKLLSAGGGKSGWDSLKREPARPTTREIASFLEHMRELQTHAIGLPEFLDIAATKLAHLTLEARALDASEMRAVTPAKRYTLAVLLIRSQLRKSIDDIAEIFIKTVRKLDNDASKRLQQYRLDHAKQVDRLVGQFREVLAVYQTDMPHGNLRDAVGAVLCDTPQTLIEECDELLAYAGDNHYPFMLRPYGIKRSLLYECLDAMQPQTTYQDSGFSRALFWLLRHRKSHKEYLPPEHDGISFDLSWAPEKWRSLILSKDDAGDLRLHRKYFELCIFDRLQRELQTGDLFIPTSDQYDDYRDHFVPEAALAAELPIYTRQVGLPEDGATFVADLKAQLQQLALATDKDFPKNDSFSWGPTGLVIHKPATEAPPPGLDALDKEINDRLGQHKVLDMLVETERWLDLHKLFGPLSGYESKLDDPRGRFVATLFCYGLNMGASQTARSLKGLSRKQIAWLNLRHATEERLDKAIVKTINAYNRFLLPRFWGTGKAVAADGTKWSMYERNLLSEYHIRYGGYGGIGDYHVSDTYIALFSHFIPCGVYEAVYILDGLIKNKSDIQPDTVHGDTQAQSAPVFGLAHLLGIELMPRIRNIKDLVFFRPDRETKYKHIDRLFSGRETINWSLIERHYTDMLRVGISIKAGTITPSTLLRRLGSENRKNKLYFAFRELGRAIRTMFLLRYISDPKMRRTINAATNKCEEFNNFAQWVFFGNEGVITENLRHEQRKVMKFNHLVANMIILNNVHCMSQILSDLKREGKFEINESTIAALSPYRTIHINRYGEYIIDLLLRVEPMNIKVKIL